MKITRKNATKTITLQELKNMIQGMAKKEMIRAIKEQTKFDKLRDKEKFVNWVMTFFDASKHSNKV